MRDEPWPSEVRHAYTKNVMSHSTEQLTSPQSGSNRPTSVVHAGIEHGPRACKAAKHTRVQHLITADETSLLELETLLVTLPICSTGRVFIEVPDAASVTDIAAPARMTVTWLDRSARSGAAGTGEVGHRAEREQVGGREQRGDVVTAEAFGGLDLAPDAVQAGARGERGDLRWVHGAGLRSRQL